MPAYTRSTRQSRTWTKFCSWPCHPVQLCFRVLRPQLTAYPRFVCAHAPVTARIDTRKTSRSIAPTSAPVVRCTRSSPRTYLRTPVLCTCCRLVPLQTHDARVVVTWCHSCSSWSSSIFWHSSRNVSSFQTFRHAVFFHFFGILDVWSSFSTCSCSFLRTPSLCAIRVCTLDILSAICVCGLHPFDAAPELLLFQPWKTIAGHDIGCIAPLTRGCST